MTESHSPMSHNHEEQFAAVKAAVESACQLARRPRGEVELVAVSKTVALDVMHDIYRCGQRHFAESRWQEAEKKTASLPDDVIWHFIGGIQRNKVRKILSAFGVIHSVDSLRLALHINGVAEDLGKSPRVFLEVNLGEEGSKGGFSMDEILSGFEEMIGLPRMQVVGLMCIPPYGRPEDSRPYFRKLRELRDRLQDGHAYPLPFLSMGMSHDFPIAIEEGATHIRVGSAIFGAREPSASLVPKVS